MEIETPWMNTKQAAKYVGLTPRHLTVICRQKNPPVNFGRTGSFYRFRRSDLDAFLMKQGTL